MKRLLRCSKRPILLVMFGVALFGSGCSQKAADYTPRPDVAEEAVRRALDAWKAGHSPGTVPETTPTVQVVDAGRKPGQRLAGFAILGETHGVASGRTFAVQLDLTDPPEQLKTQYIVVGIDPLWVFRQDDYELLSHWEHHMPAPNEKNPEPSAK